MKVKGLSEIVNAKGEFLANKVNLIAIFSCICSLYKLDLKLNDFAENIIEEKIFFDDNFESLHKILLNGYLLNHRWEWEEIPIDISSSSIVIVDGKITKNNAIYLEKLPFEDLCIGQKIETNNLTKRRENAYSDVFDFCEKYDKIKEKTRTDHNNLYDDMLKIERKYDSDEFILSILVPAVLKMIDWE